MSNKCFASVRLVYHVGANVKILPLQRSEDFGLCVYAEEDNEILLLHRIGPDDIYRKQEGIVTFKCMRVRYI